MAAGIQGRLPTVRLIEFVPENSLPVLKGEIPFFYSTSLRELGATLAATSEVVSADCGVDLAGPSAPTIGLFKATDPARYGPMVPVSTAPAEDDDPDAVARFVCDRLLAAPIRAGGIKTGNVSFRAPVGRACVS